MPQDERATSSDSPDPDPAVTAGLDSGGGVQPGDTSPDSDSMSGATGDDRRNTPNMGPVSGNRTPMIIALAERTDAALVQRIGHTAVLYRPSKDKRHIVLPRA